MGPKLIDESREIGRRSALDVQIDAVQDSATERSGGAGSSQEQVPKGISEGGSLIVRAESCGTSRTTETEGHNFTLGLTCLDIRCEESAIGQLRAWEDRVVVDIANLF